MINVLFSCVSDLFDNRCSAERIKQMKNLQQAIEASALEAWNNRNGEDVVRFCKKMSENHYRFFNVKRRPDGSLEVYR